MLVVDSRRGEERNDLLCTEEYGIYTTWGDVTITSIHLLMVA